MKAILIDDENRAIRVLQALLNETCPQIDQLWEANNLKDGVALIKKHQPDIVFLDIEMPQHSGLQILEFFKGQEIDFQIIFTTAYSQYAIEAFRLAAVDYLLKPVEDSKLIEAVSKAEKALSKNAIDGKLSKLKEAFEQLSLNKIALEVPKGIIFASDDDILFFEADGAYTKVHLLDGSTQLISKTLKHFCDQLDNKPLFYRAHRSYLINLKFMKSFTKTDGLQVIMQNGTSVPLSRDKKDEFIEMVQRIF